MTYDFTERWRALQTWFNDFPPDDQERLLDYLERLVAHTKGRDMGAFMAWVDALFIFIERYEAELEQASAQGRSGDIPTPPQHEP